MAVKITPHLCYKLDNVDGLFFKWDWFTITCPKAKFSRTVRCGVTADTGSKGWLDHLCQLNVWQIASHKMVDELFSKRLPVTIKYQSDREDRLVSSCCTKDHSFKVKQLDKRVWKQNPKIEIWRRNLLKQTQQCCHWNICLGCRDPTIIHVNVTVLSK